MNSLWLLTKKNLRLLVRAKSSALIVVFAPLLIILILGLSFNNSSQYGLNLGVYAPSFTEDVNSLVASLQEEEFKISTYDQSLEDCLADIKQGYVHACLSVPESFHIEGNEPKEITFYVDPSKVNLVYMVQRTIQEKLNLKSQEMSENLAGEILTKFDQTKTTIVSETDKITTVKDESQTAAQSMADTKTALVGLDLSPPATEYDLEFVDMVRDNLTSSVAASKSKVTAAKIALSGANVSESLKFTMTTLLEQAETGLDNTNQMINGTSGGSLGKVLDLIKVLDADLTTAKDQLLAASTQVTSSTNSLDETQRSMDEAVTKLTEVQTALSTVKTSLENQRVTEAGVISNPLVVHVETVVEESTHLNYLFSGLIVLVIMFSSLLLGTTLVMMEKKSPAFIRNFFLPVKKITFILSVYFTNLILTLIQVVVILGISLIFLPSFFSSIPVMALILFLSASVFTFLGMALGYAFNSEDTAVLASISLGSLLLFFSGLILPLEGVSAAIRGITFYNPFVISEKLVREVFIFKSSFSVLWLDLLYLLAYVVILFLVILILEVLLHKKLINRYMSHHHRGLREADKQKNNI